MNEEIEIEETFNEDEIDESMGGDHASALESVYGPDDDYFGGGEDDWLDGSYEE